MRLGDLVAAVPGAQLHGPAEREIGAIRVDSRRVEPGDLFVAYPGIVLDSHRFVPSAIAAGAAAVVVEQDVAVDSSTARVIVPSGRAAWALMSAAWHGFPSRRLTVVGVTGTDGKTTTSSMIAAILGQGHRVGVVTTVAAQIAGQALDTGLHTTTPEPPELQSFLAKMVDEGIEAAVLETTSHALALDKVLGVDYDVAVLTNVTHEHLDFHGTWDAYRDAKARLFHGLATSARKPGVPKVAVLNAEDPSFEVLRSVVCDRLIDYALDQSAALTAERIELAPGGTSFVLRAPEGDVAVSTHLLGRFNVQNAMAAAGAALGLGVPLDQIAAGLRAFQGVPGRLEAIDLGQPFGVVVDFAHTPNSLRRVLELGRSLTGGSVAVVFGCAGDRDVAKRPAMGRVAGELADRIYLTAEDPRHESLDEINAQIAAGVRSAGAEPIVEPDRGAAIARAIADARPGDLVLITGKGHEQSLAFGDDERPWDDRDAARKSLMARGYRLQS